MSGPLICPVCRTCYENAEGHTFCPKEGSYLVTQQELQAAGSDPLLGRRIGEFAIAGRIGGGGMGTVYRAIQVGVDRTVALKVLHPDLKSNAELVQRFFQEARATARLQHRYLATTYTSGTTPDGLLYIAMEYVPGGSLRQLIDLSWQPREQPSSRSPTVLVPPSAHSPGRDSLPLATATTRRASQPLQPPRPDLPQPPATAADRVRVAYMLPPERAVRLGFQVFSALAHAHRNSIVHRDLKPDNVLLAHDEDEGELVKVVDFGIAKILGVRREDAVKTQNRALIGTALYMAPEQFHSSQADPRVDVYSAGLLLYELLTGLLPFEGGRNEREIPLLLLNQRMTQPVPPPVGEGRPLSPELIALCVELLDVEPLRRPAHAGEVRDRLREVPEIAHGGWVDAAASGLFPVSQLRRVYDPAATLVNQPIGQPQQPSRRSPTQQTLIDEPMAGPGPLPEGTETTPVTAASPTATLLQPEPPPPTAPVQLVTTVKRKAIAARAEAAKELLVRAFRPNMGLLIYVTGVSLVLLVCLYLVLHLWIR